MVELTIYGHITRKYELRLTDCEVVDCGLVVEEVSVKKTLMAEVSMVIHALFKFKSKLSKRARPVLLIGTRHFWCQSRYKDAMKQDRRIVHHEVDFVYD